MNTEDKRKLNELIRRWRSVARAHGQYCTVEVVKVFAEAKRDSYGACADQLENAFGLGQKK